MDNGVRRRVLVVEDERTINQAVGDRLLAEGFDVRQAYDGPPGPSRRRRSGSPTCWSST